MNRSLFVAVALVCLLAVPAQAEESYRQEIGFSNPNLVKSSFSAGRVAIEVFAPRGVDVADLLADVDLSKSASPQSISDRVNERRQLMYPDEEIILSVTPPRPGAEQKAALVKGIYWWNNTNCSTCFWYAQYTSAIATLFIADIDYGTYNLYEKITTNAWTYRYTARAGDAATRYSFGSKTMRGFKGASAGVPSKAHIVMYFFN